VLTLSFEVKNLLDVQAEDLDGYPLPPRAAYLTLGITWDAVPERKS
jgi:iron complex outermembrane receptor protein